jgi:chromosome segregation ATPase
LLRVDQLVTEVKGKNADIAALQQEVSKYKHENSGLQTLLGNQARMLGENREVIESLKDERTNLDRRVDRQEFVITKLTEKADLLHKAAVRIRDSCGADLDHDMTREERRKDMHGFYEALKMIINQVTTIDQEIRHDHRPTNPV